MWTRLAAIAVLPLMIPLSVAAHADPDYIDPNANYAVFLQDIAYDGIVITSHEAITEGQGVCKLMQPPDGGSLWDAAQQVKSMHSDWRDEPALHFADRAIQDICPDRGGTF